AVATLFAVRFPPVPRRAEAEGAKRGVLQDAAEGWRYVGSQPALRAHLLFFALVNLGLGYVWVLHAPLVLGFAGARSLGIVGSAMGGGMLAGALAMPVWGGRRRELPGLMGTGRL